MRNSNLFLLCSIATIPFTIAAASLNDIVTYVTPKKQEDIITYEHTLEENGTLYAETTHGSISVKTWNHNKVIIEVVKKGNNKDLESLTLDTTFKDDEVFIKAHQKQKSRGKVDINIIAPHTTILTTHTDHGSIHVVQPHGPINALTTSGAITIVDSTNVVHAQSEHGAICIQQKILKEPHSIIATTQNGCIKLGLPLGANGSLQAHTTNGTLTSSLYITPETCNTKLDHIYWNKIKRECNGIFGSGGSIIKLTSKSGNISISDY